LNTRFESLKHDSGQDVSNSHPLIPRGMALPFFGVTALFLLWGIPNNLNNVLVRQFMKSFSISRFQAGLVQSAFYMGYFVLAVPAGVFMRRHGYKIGLIVGLILFGVGAILFWPAALFDRYWCFLSALFVIASGLAFLETASNPFIAQLGEPSNAARRLNLAQAFNTVGVIFGALIGTLFIFSGVELAPDQTAALQASNAYTTYLRHETMRVVVPYVVLGAVALFWIIPIASMNFSEIPAERDGESGEQGKFSGLLHCPNFLFAVIAQFAYMGASVGTWSYFISYMQDFTHQPEKIAGYFLTSSLVVFGAGRFISTAIMKRVAPSSLMGIYALTNVLLAGVGVLWPGWIGVWAIFATSFCMSVMFPTIFALGIEGLGPNTKVGGSLIIMSVVGGAVLTPLMGWMAQISTRSSTAYLMPMACWCLIAIYAFVRKRLLSAQTVS
jgi:MFS transporter, FHS family, L-fucose permease